MTTDIKLPPAHDFSRRGFLRAGVAASATLASASWTAAQAQDPKVLNYLSWPGNADPYLVSAFERPTASRSASRNTSAATR
jgi:spermidine/putrescine transport system substrate-binding protein